LRFIKTPILVKGAGATSVTGPPGRRFSATPAFRVTLQALRRQSAIARKTAHGYFIAIKPAQQHPVVSSEIITARYQIIQDKEKPPHLSARRF
jgi:hypothetical protein